MVADTGSVDIESLLLNKEYVVHQIQKLGLEKFKRYFLYPEPEMRPEDIALECNMELSEVHQLNGLVDELSILSEFHSQSALSPAHGIHYSKVASVERGPEGFVIGYFSRSIARGRYSIDHERFGELQRNGAFTRAEAGQITQLFRRLELINSRKDTVARILQHIVERQRLYFESGDSSALLPLSQRELAKGVGLVPSSISRAIRGKSLETPWREEKALKDFFPRPKRFRKELVRRLLETEREFSSDEAIRDRLEREFGVSISRRSVASLRKELRIPPAWKRNK
jgi:transposase